MLQSVHAAAEEFYDDPRIAAQVAWAAVKTKYEKVRGRWVAKNPSRLQSGSVASRPERRVAVGRGRRFAFPDPGDTVYLGEMLALAVVVDDQALVVHEYSPALVLSWSRSLRALLAKPGPHPRASCRGPKRREKAIYRRWQGWDASGCRDVTWPEPRLKTQGNAASVLYSSDKFDRKLRRWIHPFGPGVYAAVDNSRMPGLLFVQGGRLRITARGIEG